MEDRTAEFRLAPIPAFDARRGYSRWVTPGVGTRSAERGSLAEADLWVDRDGNLFARFRSRGYSLHFKMKSVLREKIAPEMRDSIEEFLFNMLIEWAVDGVDDDLECDAVEYDDND